MAIDTVDHLLQVAGGIISAYKNASLFPQVRVVWLPPANVVNWSLLGRRALVQQTYPSETNRSTTSTIIE